jgi:hypothetical protein
VYSGKQACKTRQISNKFHNNEIFYTSKIKLEMSNFWGTRAKSRKKNAGGQQKQYQYFYWCTINDIPCRQLCQYWNRLKLIFRSLNPSYKICSLLTSLNVTLFNPLCFISILIIFRPAHYFMYYNSWYSYMFRITISHIQAIKVK